MTKLVELLSEAFDDRPQIDKHEVVEGVKNFGSIGQSLFNNGNIIEVAQQLSKIAENAHTHILGEQGDWFDKVSVNKNMGILKNSVKEFKKTATEAHALNQRLQGLYEDMGHVLNRYYEIDEHLVNEKMDAVGQEDGDIDNDGDEDSSDEYLANRRKAISKAIKGEDIEETADAKLLRLAGITKEAVEAARPTKRLADIGSNIVTNKPIGDINKKI